MAPQGAFQVVERDGRTVIAPESFARYDTVARVFASLDTQGSARTYKAIKPLINDAYQEISRPGQRFDQTLANAIQKLLDTPVPEGDLEVVDTPGVNYTYAAPELGQPAPPRSTCCAWGPPTPAPSRRSCASCKGRSRCLAPAAEPTHRPGGAAM